MQGGMVEAWRTKVMATYYQRYAAMVRALDPDHLILGIRYKGVPELALFTALSPFFDVNSINDYTRSGHLKPVYATLYKATGKPLMITEFAFSGFPSPGQRSALRVAVGSQATRGLGYQTYVRQAARAPFMVGMHWFMWSDYAQAAPRGGYPIPRTSTWGSLPPMRPRYMRNSGTGSRGPMPRWRRSIAGAARRCRQNLG